MMNMKNLCYGIVLRKQKVRNNEEESVRLLLFKRISDAVHICIFFYAHVTGPELVNRGSFGFLLSISLIATIAACVSCVEGREGFLAWIRPKPLKLVVVASSYSLGIHISECDSHQSSAKTKLHVLCKGQ